MTYNFKKGDKVKHLHPKYYGRIGEVTADSTVWKIYVHWICESDGSPLKTKVGTIIKKPVFRRIHALMVEKIEGS